MKFNFNKLSIGLLVTGSLAMFTSCNKDVADPKAVTNQSSQQTLSDVISADGSLTFLKAAITRASGNTTFGTSLSTLLSDPATTYTVFAPTDAAFQLSGFPSIAAINAQRPGFLDTVLRYHVVGGSKVDSSLIPQTFPNIQLPTMLVLSPPSAAVPPGLRMSIFPSKRGTSFWANNIPLTQTNIQAANGVIHKTATIVAPPTTTLKGLLATNPAKYSILLAAITRADSAQVGLGKLDSVINYPPANLTLFAPNNDAFRAMFPPGTPDANIIGALNTYSLFPAQTVRAIVAYHLLGSRAFSVNFAAGPAPVNTQLVIPGPPQVVVPVVVTYGGVAFTVKGLVNTTASNVLTRDVHAINGVLHEIDQLLRPQ